MSKKKEGVAEEVKARLGGCWGREGEKGEERISGTTGNTASNS